MQSTDCKENWMESLSLGISSWRKERKFGLIWRLGKPNLNLSYLSSEEDLIRLPKLLIWMKSVLASTFPLLGSVGDILRNVSSHDMLSILYSLPFSPCHLGPPAPSSLSLWVGANERKVASSWATLLLPLPPPTPPPLPGINLFSCRQLSWWNLGNIKLMTWSFKNWMDKCSKKIVEKQQYAKPCCLNLFLNLKNGNISSLDKKELRLNL